MSVALPLAKPRLRGVLHQYAFFAAVVAGVLLIVFAPGESARWSVSVYAASLAGLLGTSAVYHRRDWVSARARQWMRRLDHAMIFVLIAGTFTPFCVLVLHGPMRIAVLTGIWGGALVAIVRELAWIDAPKWLSPLVSVALGWSAVVLMPQLWAALGGWGVGLVALGGVLYTLGAIAFATGRPDPSPTVFGYHEVFHLCTVLAAAAQFAAVAAFLLPSVAAS